MSKRLILAFSTKGSGSNDEHRLRGLLSRHPVEFVPFDYSRKRESGLRILREIRQRRPALVVMEGTGIAGGLACIVGRLLFGVKYVVSSGDAVGPFMRARSLVTGPLFAAYERVLCRLCAGFIGWTPYLAGRAMTFGAPRAMTAAGWAPFEIDETRRLEARGRIRRQLGIGEKDIIIGLVGSLAWASRQGYCYGYDLVSAAGRIDRPDVNLLICGGGTGLARLQAIAGERLGRSIHLTGEVPWEQVPDYLSAMDVGALPQSVDGVGSFRYTTKISEYLAARLPVVTSQIPMSYDLDGGWMWRLPGERPWSDRYIDALAGFMRSIQPEQIDDRRRAIPAQSPQFDRDRQVERATQFIGDILDSASPPREECSIAEGAYAKKQLFCRSRLIAFSHGSRFKLARKLVEPYAGSTLLDYGCGDGSFLAMVAHLFPRAMGADVDEKQNEDCARRFGELPSVSFVHTTALREPSHEGAYKVVTCMETLEHVPEDAMDPVIEDLHRCVSRDGVVIISVPIEIGPTLPLKQIARRIAGWRKLGDYQYNERYTLRELVTMIFATRTTQIDRPRYPFGPRHSHGHKGFNWRRLRERLEQAFVVRQTRFSPFGWSGGFLSSQAWFICRRK